MQNLIYISPELIEYDAKIILHHLVIDNKLFLIISNNRNTIHCIYKNKEHSYFRIIDKCLFKTNKRFELLNSYYFFNSKYYLAKYIPNYSCVYKNDLFLLSQRCGCTTVSSAITCLNGNISYEYYKNNNDCVALGRNYINNTYRLTLELLKNKKYNIFMFVRDPIVYCLSLYNLLLEPFTSIDELLTVVDNSKININESINTNIHYRTLSLMFTDLRLTVDDVTFIPLSLIETFFMTLYNFNIIKRNITSKKLITRSDLTELQCEQIKNIYIDDFNLL